MVKRYIQGFSLDTDHLALDVIKNVGPGGHFLAEKHTRDYCVKEHWRPTIFNRRSLPNWLKNGKKTVNEKLVEKAREILQTHHPEPLLAEVKTDLDQIWSAAQKKARR